MDIRIALGSATPIYRQIVDQVCQATAAGSLGPGDALPSVRALAEQLLINPNTVARAYAELQREGVVEAQRGRGLFVAERRPVFSAEERRRRLDRALDVFLNEIRLLGLSRSEVYAALEEALPGASAPAAAGGGPA